MTNELLINAKYRMWNRTIQPQQGVLNQLLLRKDIWSHPEQFDEKFGSGLMKVREGI